MADSVAGNASAAWGGGGGEEGGGSQCGRARAEPRERRACLMQLNDATCLVCRHRRRFCRPPAPPPSSSKTWFSLQLVTSASPGSRCPSRCLACLAFSLPGVSEPRASRPHGREGGLSSDLVHWNILRERHLRSLPPHQSGSALQVSCGSFLSSEESLPDAAPLSRFCPLGILHKFIISYSQPKQTRYSRYRIYATPTGERAITAAPPFERPGRHSGVTSNDGPTATAMTTHRARDRHLLPVVRGLLCSQGGRVAFAYSSQRRDATSRVLSLFHPPRAARLLAHGHGTWTEIIGLPTRTRRPRPGAKVAVVARRRQSIHVIVRYNQGGREGEREGGRREGREGRSAGQKKRRERAEAAVDPPSSTALTYFFNVLSFLEFLLSPSRLPPISTTVSSLSDFMSCAKGNAEVGNNEGSEAYFTLSYQSRQIGDRARKANRPLVAIRLLSEVTKEGQRAINLANTYFQGLLLRNFALFLGAERCPYHWGCLSCHASLHLFPSRTLYTHRFLFAYRRRHLSFFYLPIPLRYLDASLAHPKRD